MEYVALLDVFVLKLTDNAAFLPNDITTGD
jgi:hypothetical protein